MFARRSRGLEPFQAKCVNRAAGDSVLAAIVDGRVEMRSMQGCVEISGVTSAGGVAVVVTSAYHDLELIPAEAAGKGLYRTRLRSGTKNFLPMWWLLTHSQFVCRLPRALGNASQDAPACYVALMLPNSATGIDVLMLTQRDVGVQRQCPEGVSGAAFMIFPGYSVAFVGDNFINKYESGGNQVVTFARAPSKYQLQLMA